jgi:hypothetical protein
MASSGKKKTTMAKLTRESKLRERRMDKQAKKDARKLAPAHHSDQPNDTLLATTPLSVAAEHDRASGSLVTVPPPGVEPGSTA